MSGRTRWYRDSPHPFRQGRRGSAQLLLHLSLPGCTRASNQDCSHPAIPLLAFCFPQQKEAGTMGGGTRKTGGGKDPTAASARSTEGKGTASARLPFPKPPTLLRSLQCRWPQEPCLLLCAGCESRPPDRRILVTESWKWFRQWLGPFITGRRGQSRENKSDLASCAEADPLFGNGHVLYSSPAWESCKAIANGEQAAWVLPAATVAPRLMLCL